MASTTTSSELDPTNFKAMIDQVVGAYPNVQVVATTLRRATTANRNDWGAVAYAEGAFHLATARPTSRSSIASAAATGSRPG